MPADSTVGAAGAPEDSGLPSSVYLVPTLIYPLWHLAAPRDARDPWLVWWLVGASFLAVAAGARAIPAVARRARELFAACTALVTLHLFSLASLNDMQPFYAVGSSLAVATASFSIRTTRVLIAYVAFAAGLGVLLYAAAPDPRKLAYWGGMLPVAAFAYSRLSAQIAAAALARENQERLEQRVEERTAELEEANRRLRREMEQRVRLEEELRLSQKLEALGRLAGGVAHDFNNLLTTIRLYAQLLREGLPARSDLHDEIDQIQKAGRQASDLTQQLLAFSRRGDVETELLDLDEVIAESASILRHLLGEDVRMLCRLDESRAPVIRAARSQVEQVLVNLVLNARDAMPEGGCLTLETSILGRGELRARELPESLDAEAYVLLEVSDTGVGMDPETRARAFDPFFTRKQVGRGTGLGLSIVYGILNHGGGHVRVQSEPGKGARFELLWPWVDERPAPRSGAAARAEPARRAARILLVEDEEDLRRVLGRVLARCGYTVVDAADAESALEIASRDPAPIHLVVSDVVMPRMSGLELFERLAALRPDARVLLISGHLDHPSLRAREIPAHIPLLHKPFDADALIESVRKVLDS
jgi:signal transduction histidine kinase